MFYEDDKILVRKKKGVQTTPNDEVKRNMVTIYSVKEGGCKEFEL